MDKGCSIGICLALLLVLAGTGWAQSAGGGRGKLGSELTMAGVATTDGSSGSSDVAGTWFFSCCDGSERWVGMIVLVQKQAVLRGAFLNDEGSHGSYIEGDVQGERVRLTRRWYTGGVLHEQFYELRHDVRSGQLSGSFTEPAYEKTAHRIHIERGFTNKPRRGGPASSAATSLQRATDDSPRGIGDTKAGDSKRPCDCGLACYCGGIPPGRQVEEERSRCLPACRCPVCPPLP